MPDVLHEYEISMERLENLFHSAFVPCTRDPDGDIRIEEEGVRTFLKLDVEKKLIVMFSIWPMRASVSEGRKLEWINELNRKLVLVKFQMVRPDVLWCDYQLRYEGGVSPMQLVGTVRLFSRVCRGAAAQKGGHEIIGKD